MAAATHDIYIEQGATFRLSLVWKDSAQAPINLTGYTARMQIRQSIASSTTVLSLTTAQAITLGGALGTIEVVISAAQTSALTIRKGVYDLELEASNGVVTRLLQGSVEVSPEVTR
jgi:hypothetical protein